MKNPWHQLSIRKPYVIPEDRAAIERFNCTAKKERQVRLELMPEPFIGSIDAPVVLLNLNPGFSDDDVPVHADAKFRTLVRRNLLHKRAAYPFFFLDTSFESPGRRWWESKLRQLLERVRRKTLARRILCVEYFPYHSRRFGRSLGLASEAYSQWLVVKAIERGALIVIMRGEGLWLEAVESLDAYPRRYRLNSPQNVCITHNNCPSGFEEIVKAIGSSAS